MDVIAEEMLEPEVFHNLTGPRVSIWDADKKALETIQYVLKKEVAHEQPITEQEQKVVYISMYQINFFFLEAH